MKKERIIVYTVLALVLLALIGCTVAYYYERQPKTPYSELTASEVEGITLIYGIHSYELSEGEIAELIPLIQKLVIYERDDSWREYDGCSFTDIEVRKKDGVAFTLHFMNPFILIDGKGYRCEYKPCDNAGRYVYQIARREFHGE